MGSELPNDFMDHCKYLIAPLIVVALGKPMTPQRHIHGNCQQTCRSL